MTTIVKRAWLQRRWNEPKTEHMVEIEIDDERIVQLLGSKALGNKSKKSKIQGGVVTCVIRPIRVQS